MGCKQSKPVQTRTSTMKTASTKPVPDTANSGITTTNEMFKLPAGCEVGTVGSVLDGNRLTLEDGRTIRLLGVKAPSVEKTEPFGIESRDLLKSLCPVGSKVYLEAETSDVCVIGGDTPRYLYVKDTTTVLSEDVKFANYEALRSGLSTYDNHEGIQLQHSHTLLKGVREGRLSKLGCWKSFDSTTMVHSVKGGTVYHREQCEKIVHEMHLIEYTTGDAVDEGLVSCTICKA